MPIQQAPGAAPGACCIIEVSLLLQSGNSRFCSSFTRRKIIRALHPSARQLKPRGARKKTGVAPPNPFFSSRTPRSPQRAHCYSGDIPNPSKLQLPYQCCLVDHLGLVCGGDTDARHLPIPASSINRKQFWSFWLAISKPGWTSRKKSPTWNLA